MVRGKWGGRGMKVRDEGLQTGIQIRIRIQIGSGFRGLKKGQKCKIIMM